jgi:trans-aconitate 2-methyltransferase
MADASGDAGPREWDARTYDRISDHMFRMGVSILDRLELRGDEAVLDAGCGSGRVTEELVARLPRGRVVALDGSAAMIEEARARLAPAGSRVEYVVADLSRSIPLARPVDAILSTATFHWIPDHAALFRNLAAVLSPGGRLVAQYGGAGNVAALVAVLRQVGDGWPGPWNFSSADEAKALLGQAGFVDVRTWLHEEEVELERGEQLETFLRTISLGAHLERLAASEHDAFVHQVADRLPSATLDYVRLNIVARRACS